MPPLACLTGNDPLAYSFFSNAGLPLPDNTENGWGIVKSSSLYRVENWGSSYFFINEKGHIAVRPHGKTTIPEEEIDILAAVQKVVESKQFAIPLPLIIRFPDILRDRLDRLQEAFENATKVHHYQGRFQGVFPVKCNQDRYVVENIVHFGRVHRFGLEAGSKPELLAAMSYLCMGDSDALLICNGYKDSEYVALALTARRLGLNCALVLEQEEELEIIVKMSRQLSIQPLIGVRAKLNTRHGGHFGETSGENGKFGLSSIEIVRIVQKLRRIGMLHCLQLLHFHIGSQIPSLALLNDGVSEAAHIYCELSLMGSNMKYIDIGGGLGIDYDGSLCARSDMSIGYTMEEYADQVVLAIKKACMLKKVRHPILCSESGRALASHHSVLVFDVLSCQLKDNNEGTDLCLHPNMESLPEDLATVYRSMEGFAREREHERSLGCATLLKEKCTDLFKDGRLSLTQFAAINSMYQLVSQLAEDDQSCKIGLQTKSTQLEHNAVYHINLSIFKSMPDSWAIGQLFPILPLHRLQERPTVRAILSDLTCDSDGRITSFIGTDSKGRRLHHLPVHALEGNKPYYLGMFLGGAYQEALGGLHNLFGNPNVVHVVQSGTGTVNFKVTKAIPGQTAADVLRCMQHDPRDMFHKLKRRVHRLTQENSFEEDHKTTATEVIERLAKSFESSTYLKMSSRNSRSVFNCKASIIASSS